MKLFAISRSESIDPIFSKTSTNTMEGGRYVVLVSLDLSDILVNWISEEEAKFALQQLKEFDPARQPLAFVDVTTSERAVEARKESFSSEIADAYSNQVSPVPDGGSSNHRLQKPRERLPIDANESEGAKDKQSFGWWLIAGLIVTLSIVALVKGRRSR